MHGSATELEHTELGVVLILEFLFLPLDLKLFKRKKHPNSGCCLSSWKWPNSSSCTKRNGSDQREHRQKIVREEGRKTQESPLSAHKYSSYCPSSQKDDNKCISMAYESEFSTIISIYMELCVYSDYCKVVCTGESPSFSISSSAKPQWSCSCCVPLLQLLSSFCIIMYNKVFLFAANPWDLSHSHNMDPMEILDAGLQQGLLGPQRFWWWRIEKKPSR